MLSDAGSPVVCPARVRGGAHACMGGLRRPVRACSARRRPLWQAMPAAKGRERLAAAATPARPGEPLPWRAPSPMQSSLACACMRTAAGGQHVGPWHGQHQDAAGGVGPYWDRGVCGCRGARGGAGGGAGCSAAGAGTPCKGVTATPAVPARARPHRVCRARVRTDGRLAVIMVPALLACAACGRCGTPTTHTSLQATRVAPTGDILSAGACRAPWLLRQTCGCRTRCGRCGRRKQG